LRTASLWGKPPSRFYRFLGKVSSLTCDSSPSLAALGCADGKFVLPAARRSFNVLAIDVDHVALYGGLKPGIGGVVHMPGLVARLKAENLAQRVDVVCADFATIRPRPMDSVFVSGAIQYSHNLPRTAEEILDAALSFVRPGGLFYLDYMLPYEAKYIGRPNCPDAGWWRQWLARPQGWHVMYHRVLPPVRDPAHVEFPVDHFHQWGHVLMQRLW
jgi:SAM-dependent methyltransferase